MPISKLSEITWTALRDADRAQMVALLPVGATEAHGPHLPLSTDVIIAEAMVRQGAERLSEHGLHALIMPPVAYTCAGFAAAFPGTISLRPETVTALLVDLARSLTAMGVGALVFANAHLDPGHLGSLYAAKKQIKEEGLLPVAFPDIARKPWALRMSDEFKSGACHAGQYETSVVMAERPDLVEEHIRVQLDANPSSLSVAIRKGLGSFEEAGGPEAYFGFPAQASAAEGHETRKIMGNMLYESALSALTLS